MNEWLHVPSMCIIVSILNFGNHIMSVRAMTVKFLSAGQPGQQAPAAQQPAAAQCPAQPAAPAAPANPLASDPDDLPF